MASIDSLTFDKAVYNPGDAITLAVAYTPDAPSVVPEPFTATVTLTSSAGVEVGSGQAVGQVNQSQPAGDVLGCSDTGNRTWTLGNDTGTTADFTSTA